jgi:hypothetical protein
MFDDEDYGIFGKGLEGYINYLKAVEKAGDEWAHTGRTRKNNNGGCNSGCIVKIILGILIYAIVKTIMDW